MNVERLHEILAETTAQFRKGAEVEERGGVTHIYMMPHERDAAPGVEMVDMEFVQIGVNVSKAQAIKGELAGILRSYPDPARLAGGPSYIEVGAVLGDQGAAFCLFALGKALGFWDVITPRFFGITGDEARAMAGQGFIMITGFDPAETGAQS